MIRRLVVSPMKQNILNILFKVCLITKNRITKRTIAVKRISEISFLLSFLLSLPHPSDQLLMHPDHQSQHAQQIYRKHLDTDILGDHSEKRRHHTGAHIGTCHLYPNNRLRFVCAKIIWCGMNDAWIDRCTSQSQQYQPNACRHFSKWKKQ